MFLHFAIHLLPTATYVLSATTACNPQHGSLCALAMGISSSSQLFESPPGHSVCLRLPESTRRPTVLRTTRILASLLPSGQHCQTRPATLSAQRRLPAMPRESARRIHARARLPSKRRNLESDANAQTSQTPISTSSLGVQSSSCSRCWASGHRPQTHRLIHHSTQLLLARTGITSSLGSLLNNKSDNNLTHATDVWYLTRGLYRP